MSRHGCFNWRGIHTAFRLEFDNIILITLSIRNIFKFKPFFFLVLIYMYRGGNNGWYVVGRML